MRHTGILLAIIVLLILNSDEILGQWLEGYACRNRIEIAAGNISGSQDLINFPLLISLNKPELRTVYYSGQVFNNNDLDIRFTGGDGTTLLAYEIELYGPSSGELSAWVRIPALSPNKANEIFIYYGNPNSSNNTGSTNVWSSNYRGVWHMNLNANDASAYANHGTDKGTTSAPGKIGLARSFDGLDDYIAVPYSSSLNIQDQISIEAWVRFSDSDEYYGGIFSKEPDYELWYAKEYLRFFAGENLFELKFDFDEDEWYHICATYDRSFQRIFVNGTEVGSFANTLEISNDPSSEINIGFHREQPESGFFGALDEIRLSATTLSPDWINTSYRNQNNPEGFSGVSSSELSNDNPCNARHINLNDDCASSIFSNELASNSGIPLISCGGYGGSDAWFSLELPSTGSVVLKLESGSSPEVPFNGDWIKRPGLAVYNGTCENLTADTCWIDPNNGAPFQMPEIELSGYTPEDTIYLRVWGYNNSTGKFRICAEQIDFELFNVSGSGAYCPGESGLSVHLDGSQVGVDYQLTQDGINVGDPIPGSGEALEWSGRLRGVYEVHAYSNLSDDPRKMKGKAVLVQNPPPVITFGFEFYKTLTIHSDSVEGSENLEHFPLLVSLPSDPDLRNVEHGGKVYHSAGYDIVFTDVDFNPIPFEFIRFDPLTGAYSAWVNVPNISPEKDTPIHMLYGNSETTSDHSSRETWNSNYVQVLHLDGDLNDASFYGNYGINDGTLDTIGKIDSARKFDGQDDIITVFDDPALDGTNDASTLSLWINYVDASDGDHQLVLSSENRFSSEEGGYEWGTQGGGEHFFYPNGSNNSNFNIVANPFEDGKWHYLAVTLNFFTLEVDLFVDGNKLSLLGENVPLIWSDLAELDNWLWGGNPDRSSRYFKGLMDEIRIQTGVRSDAWLKTEFTNQNNPSGFYSISSEIAFETLPVLCSNSEPFPLIQAKPMGGIYSGEGVSEGIFFPEIAGQGIHSLTYTYTDEFGCFTSGSEMQSVLNSPSPVITGNTELCSYASSEIYSSPFHPGHLYNWELSGEGASIQSGQGTNEIMVNWGLSSGTLSVRETDTITGCDSMAMISVVLENEPGLILSCNEDLLVYLDDQCEYILPDYRSAVTVIDNCGQGFTLSQLPPSGTSISGSGTTQEIIISATDSAGNKTDCNFHVSLLDNTLPVARNLRDTVITLTEDSYDVLISLPVPDFHDNCGISSAINNLNGGSDPSGVYPFGITIVTYTVTDIHGNIGTFDQTVEVRHENPPDHGLIIPEAFSPNEDGLNDQFVILGLDTYSSVELQVFNVNGIQVYNSSDYDNSWDGSSIARLGDNTKLPTGTYYYVLILNPGDMPIKGFIYLRRE